MKDDCTQYAIDVIGGKIPAGEMARWSCQRHLDDLKSPGEFYFDQVAANHIKAFAGILIQFEGEFSGQALTLLPWQAFVFGCIYGWKRKSDHLRRYRTAYVEVPRKNGKSVSAVVPPLYALAWEKEPAAQCFALATKEQQAKIVWNAAWKMVSRTPALRKRLRKRFNSVENEKNFSEFKPLGSDSDTLDGLNPHIAVCDELHAWKNRDLWDVIKDGMGARRQPLMFAITTAGYNQLGVCYELRTHGRNVIDPTLPEYQDDSFFCYIAAPSKANEDKWDEEATWYEANPSLGVTKKVEYLRDQCERAKKIPSERNTFLNKQLNIWTSANEQWIDPRKWDECAAQFELEDMRNQPCFAAIDLAKVNDISSVALVFPPHAEREKWRALTLHYIPENDIQERSKKVPYETWRDQGLLVATPGDCTDYDFIRHDINRVASIININCIAYDRHFAHELITHLGDDGFDCVGFGQGFISMSAPTSELERMIISKEIEHNGDRVLRWMVGNVVTVKDPAGNVKPDKSKAQEKIDGAVALIMGIGVAMTNVIKKSAYESRGVRTI